MKRFYLNDDQKPCIWPVPDDCLWTGENCETRNGVNIEYEGPYEKEADYLYGEMEMMGLAVKKKKNNKISTIILMPSNTGIFETGGYALDVNFSGTIIKSSNAEGILNGCRTLLQLIDHGFDGSVSGVHITDTPKKSFRGLKISFPADGDMDRLKKSIKIAGKWKYNKVILCLKRYYDVLHFDILNYDKPGNYQLENSKLNYNKLH